MGLKNVSLTENKRGSYPYVRMEDLQSPQDILVGFLGDKKKWPYQNNAVDRLCTIRSLKTILICSFHLLISICNYEIYFS